MKQILDSIPLTYLTSIYFNPSLRERILSQSDKMEIKKFLMEEYDYIEDTSPNKSNGIGRLNEISNQMIQMKNKLGRSFKV